MAVLVASAHARFEVGRGVRGLESFDVDAPQPEPGDQQDDRVVAFAARVSPVDRFQDLGHVGRIPDRPDPGMPGPDLGHAAAGLMVTW